MTGLGEDVYTDRSTALDALTEESQRMGMYDHIGGVNEMVEAAATALDGAADAEIERLVAAGEVAGMADFPPSLLARAALESLGIPLSVLAALRDGEWVAVPKELTASMYSAHSESYEYVPPGAERAWRVLLSAAPKTPEEAR